MENRDRFRQLLDEYRDRLQAVMQHNGNGSLELHRSRNKLLARERVDLLIDSNTSFLELSPLAAYGMHQNQFPAAGLITGIGRINGREAVIIANDATVKGGTYIEESVKKHIRAQEIALQNSLPCVYLVDSGGIYLPDQARVFPDRFDFGRFFYNQARLSALKIPQIALVMGSCTAGGAYVPAMCDETIIVRDQGTIFIGGPPLVRAATGEVVTAEELGGAEVHTRLSGTADHLAEDDRHAIQICRNIFETFPAAADHFPFRQSVDEPWYDPQELYGLAPTDLKQAVDAHEIIARIVDGSRFHEFKASYAPTLVTGFAHILGFPVGVVANNGVLFGESALKGAHFIELCTSRKIPLFFLQNITGFIVGKEYEHRGIARDGAKMVHAVANAAVPKFTVIFGGSFGAGNYAMAGRAYDPRLLFMWPNARISVMGGEQAAEVLASVKEQQLLQQGNQLPPTAKERLTKEIREKYEEEGSPYYSTARLWDDGIIDPVDTRRILGLGLALAAATSTPDTTYGIFRM